MKLRLIHNLAAQYTCIRSTLLRSIFINVKQTIFECSHKCTPSFCNVKQSIVIYKHVLSTYLKEIHILCIFLSTKQTLHIDFRQTIWKIHVFPQHTCVFFQNNGLSIMTFVLYKCINNFQQIILNTRTPFLIK